MPFPDPFSCGSPVRLGDACAQIPPAVRKFIQKLDFDFIIRERQFGRYGSGRRSTIPADIEMPDFKEPPALRQA